MERVCDSCLYIMTTELDNPGLWSHEMVEKAVEGAGDVPCDIESTRLIIRNYLGVLRDALRASRRTPK